MNTPKTLIAGNFGNGGVATVINVLMQTRLADYLVCQKPYIPASKQLNWLRFLFYYIYVYTFTLLTDRKIKVVHILSADRGSIIRKIIMLFIAKLLGKKTIINIHSCSEDLLYNDSLFPSNIIVGSMLNNADKILVLSKRWKEVIEKKCSNPDIEILYNPIKMKEQVFNNSETVKVTFMGRLGKRKGAYDLIEAARELKDAGVQINMFGDGDLDEIKELVSRYELENTVNIAGWISGNQVENAYKDSDIFILPSYDEGLPMSILEAMSYGLPVISTTVGGIPEQVEDGESGYLIEPGNIGQIVSKIKILAQDSELRKKMGERSYEIAKEKFEAEIIAAKLAKIYTELVS